jgi:hypothetical protein
VKTNAEITIRSEDLSMVQPPEKKLARADVRTRRLRSTSTAEWVRRQLAENKRPGRGRQGADVPDLADTGVLRRHFSDAVRARIPADARPLR